MANTIEVLKQMVEALEWCHGGEPVGTAEAIKAGKQAIAELESQEPVMWITPSGEGFRIRFTPPTNDVPLGWDALYNHPPQEQQSCDKRTWVGLTDEEIIDVIHPLVMADMPDQATDYEIAKAIEAKLKEKNT
jgi:hypothetical protein